MSTPHTPNTPTPMSVDLDSLTVGTDYDVTYRLYGQRIDRTIPLRYQGRNTLTRTYDFVDDHGHLWRLARESVRAIRPAPATE